jgi:hypothetical protein
LRPPDEVEIFRAQSHVHLNRTFTMSFHLPDGYFCTEGGNAIIATITSLSSTQRKEKPKVMKHRLMLSAAAIVLLVTASYAKHEKMPLPEPIMIAKTIYIDNQSGMANLGDKAYDEVRKWGRFQIVDSADKADVVLLLSAKEYVSGYTSGSYHNTNATVDSYGNVNGQTYGSGTSQAVYSGTTYLTIVDPKTGARLWSDAREWGRWRSATRGLIKELRDRMHQQESRK